MSRIGVLLATLTAGVITMSSAANPARALERPWISDVFFYWYEWDQQQQWGNWAQGGVYYTPLLGYYDSRQRETNRRQLQTAAEWGMTHHFMDYWGPGWLGEDGAPRERTVMEAAEQVRAAGYQAWMGYYQDGSNFEMRQFARNLSEQRDAYHWLKHYAPCAAWPRLNGYPFQMVYARNGVPEITIDDTGFREFLRRRYGSLAAINDAWGTSYQSLDDIHMTFDVTGPQRADAVDYQYHLWETEWARLNRLVREQFGYPGIKVSFDVGYAPFRGSGFCDFARVFGGPHSYAGVFGPPHEQDVERFIQSIVAKRYNTVFFDHLKGYYCDWNTLGRIPGTQYPAEPFAYDRFWVGNLMRYNEAVLHLSWNEWWEGSNLEPSLELGKQYCEQNLFYSTLMQLCFPALRDFGKGASVAVLLNDWAFKCASEYTSEIYSLIQELRRSMVPFDLVVDDLVTPATLRRFNLVFAPAAGIGFGRNARGQPIAPLLAEWVKGDSRRLVASDCRQLRQLLGVQVQTPPESARPGPDLSLFIDVGAPGDERYLRSGFSGRENWSQLPQGAFGQAAQPYTVRWTPGQGRVLTLLLPVSPNRNHLLRFSGSVLRAHQVSVRVEGREVDRVQLQEGVHDYRARLPRAAVGPHDFVEIELVFEKPIIPGEIDPERFPDESRACNLALDWLQVSTANLEFSRDNIYEPPSPLVDFASPIYGALTGQSRAAALGRRDHLVAPGAQVAARYRAGGAPRDLLLRNGSVLYVNGRMDDVAPREWLAAVLHGWAGKQARTRVVGDDIIGCALRSDNTVILLAYNYDPSRPRRVELSVETQGRPVAQVTALRRDGEAYLPLSYDLAQGCVVFSDTLRYYGVYEVAFAPVQVELGGAPLHPGQPGRLALTIGADREPVAGKVALLSPVPSVAMQGEPVPFQARPGENLRLDLPVSVRDDADWGQKTIALRVETERGAALFFRPLEIEPNPQLQPEPRLIDGRQPRLTLVNAPPAPARRCAPATDVVLHIEGQQVSFGDIASGQRVTRPLPIRQPSAARPRLRKVAATICYTLWGKQVSQPCELELAIVPAEASGPAPALAAVYVFNPDAEPLENYPVLLPLPSSLGGVAPRLYVLDDDGRPLPTQVDPGGELSFIGTVPGASAATFYLALAPSEAERPAVPTDLTIEPRSPRAGAVRLANSRLALVISAARGGTVTSLKSQTTGREYGADSLGIAYGEWSAPPDLSAPARQPQHLVAEKRVRQADRPATVELLAAGPVRAVARVTWEDEMVRCEQTYELRAFEPCLRVSAQVTPSPRFAAQELVLLDARFRAAGLTKIYPGFSGMLGEFEREHPHFGWREGAHVPPLATLMSPPDFVESLSLNFTRVRGADWWRQGFWPLQRPQPGRCEYAWCELVSRSGARGEVEAQVLLHPGSHAAAATLRRRLQSPPLAVVVEVTGEWKRDAAPEPGGSG